MINFDKYPRTNKTTYTIIKRYQTRQLRTALELAKEQNWKIRTCSVHDKSMLNDIKNHLPEWFDARYAVLISNFEPNYVKQHINEIYEDKDVNTLLEKENKQSHQDYMKGYIG